LLGPLTLSSFAHPLKDVYATLQSQFGYDTIRGDASTSWFRLGSGSTSAARRGCGDYAASSPTP
jgi:hypothetical protein